MPSAAEEPTPEPTPTPVPTAAPLNISITANSCYTAALRRDGTVISTVDDSLLLSNMIDAVKQWKDITALYGAPCGFYGLRADGTVVPVGNSKHGNTDVSDWTNIVSVCQDGRLHTVGLRDDGTVVSLGTTYKGVREVDTWREIYIPGTEFLSEPLGEIVYDEPEIVANAIPFTSDVEENEPVYVDIVSIEPTYGISTDLITGANGSNYYVEVISKCCTQSGEVI